MEPHATLNELAQEIPGARVLQGDPSVRVGDVRHDSRDVEPGDLFVVRRGLKDDGARFIPQAISRGAVALIADRELETDLPLIRVPDAEIALALASSAVWRHPSFTVDVIGITGTNGKTTTAWLLEHAMTSMSMKTGLLGTVEHRFGNLRWPALHTTPESDDLARRTAAMRDAGAEYLVMEVSSHAIAMKRVHAVRFRAAVLTNVTQDHLDYHGSFEAYARAKKALFLEMGPAACVVNLDDAVGREIASQLRSPISYSAKGNDGAAIRVLDAQLDANGIHARVKTPDTTVSIRSPLAGWHNLENVLAALGTLIALEVPASRAAESLADAIGAPGRLERVRTSNSASGPQIFVDYAHTPDALSNVLRALRATNPKRLICLFGCGGDRDPSKRAPMGEAVANGADIAILTTDNPRTEDPAKIAQQASEGLIRAGMPVVARDALHTASRGYVIELDRRRAIDLAIAHAGPQDVVLLAGKGHEPYQEVNGIRSPFDDREEARRALETTRQR